MNGGTIKVAYSKMRQMSLLSVSICGGGLDYSLEESHALLVQSGSYSTRSPRGCVSYQGIHVTNDRPKCGLYTSDLDLGAFRNPGGRGFQQLVRNESKPRSVGQQCQAAEADFWRRDVVAEAITRPRLASLQGMSY